MSTIMKIIVILMGAFFALVGTVGLFQPAQLAAQFGFELTDSVAVGQARAVIGAHYFAMGLVCIFAAVRNLPALLFPIGVIEGMMVVARILSGFSGEFNPSVIGPTTIEVVASVALLGLSLPAIMKR